MYPNLKYNDSTDRDWLSHAKAPANRPLIDSDGSINATVMTECHHNLHPIAGGSCASTVVPCASPQMRSRRRVMPGVIPLTEREEKQSARSL